MRHYGACVRSSTTPDVTPIGYAAEPAPAFREVSERERWRGTPELFAHLARVVRRTVADGQTGSPTLTIDVEVKDDHELFTDANDFLANVTPEGLRHFRSICIRSEGSARVAAITLRWRRPWWRPATSPDGEVLVEVTGELTWRDETRKTIETALARGDGRVGSKWATAIGGWGAAAALGVTAVSIGYLLKINEDVTLYAAGLLSVAGLIGGALWGTWAIPSLEIAPVGQTNIRRILKFVGPIVVAIALAGLTKKLFG